MSEPKPKPPSKRDLRLAARRMVRARDALAKLSDGQRNTIFSEMSQCMCNRAVQAAVSNPRKGLAALAGAAFGVILEETFKEEKKLPRNLLHDPSLKKVLLHDPSLKKILP